MRSGGWAKRLAKTANGPSRPANSQWGGTRASCSWPSATSTLPPATVTDGGPSDLGTLCFPGSVFPAVLSRPCFPGPAFPTNQPRPTSRPAPTGLPGVWTATATLATGWGTVIARTNGVSARAGNHRVEPSGVVSPIWVPAAMSWLASASGTSTRDTSLVPPRYQVAR